MAIWEEAWAFIRGTRPRPPPGRSRPVVAFLLALAAIAHLPVVYLLVGARMTPLLVLAVGLLAMGLAWSAGISLEGRRRKSALVASVLGTAEVLLAFLPGGLGGTLGVWRYALVLTSACSAAAWALLRTD